MKRDTFLTRKLIPRAFVSLFSVGEWATLRRRRRRRRDNVRNEYETLGFSPRIDPSGLGGGFVCVQQLLSHRNLCRTHFARPQIGVDISWAAGGGRGRAAWVVWRMQFRPLFWLGRWQRSAMGVVWHQQFVSNRQHVVPFRRRHRLSSVTSVPATGLRRPLLLYWCVGVCVSLFFHPSGSGRRKRTVAKGVHPCVSESFTGLKCT